MLRLAVESDFEEVYAIYMDPTVNPYMSWEVMDPEVFRPIFRSLLSEGVLYVHETENIIVSAIKLDRKKYRQSHCAYIGGFGIKAARQSKGLGTHIMTEVIDKLTREGVRRIELIVESDNPRAMRLYEKLGFKKEGTLRNFFKRENQDHFIDDYYMALLIN